MPVYEVREVPEASGREVRKGLARYRGGLSKLIRSVVEKGPKIMETGRTVHTISRSKKGLRRRRR